jgi:hypothetical protein
VIHSPKVTAFQHSLSLANSQAARLPANRICIRLTAFAVTED